MCRQFPHRAPAPAAGQVHRPEPRRTVTRSAAVILATGLLIGLNSTPAVPQQSPDTWSAERRAVLPSGLSVQLDFAPLPGVNATPSPGKLAERSGSGPAYTDGMRAGDPAETFLVAEQRPRADGSWRTLGTLQLSFSRPVRNPRLHLSGLAGVAAGKDGTTGTGTRLTVTGGSPSAPTLVGRTPWTGWTVAAGELSPTGDGTEDGNADGAGTVELAGTLSTVTLRVEQRSTARAGSTTAPAALRQAYTVTLDEGLGTAPQGYGNASHVVSDLFLGQDAAPAATRSRPGLTGTVERALLPGPAAAPPPPPPDAGPVTAGPVVELDGGASRRSPFANPAPPQLQPGRGEYQGADPTLKFPAETAVGRYYHLDVPVSPGGGSAVLAGWIDFDHNGHFDATERVQAEVPAVGSTVALEWTVPQGATAGETWARLRLARNGSQLVGSGGFADSGQVVDQRVQIAVGAAKPEIAGPVSGTVTADARPEFRGEGAVAGATVAVMEGDTVLCRGRAAGDGTWSCRPDRPLAEGRHDLVPVETTKGGMVLRGEPIRLTVKTAPPTAPVLTLPEYTNDPGLLVTGLGEPGSTVSVNVAAVAGRPTAELCSTAVAADGTWSCLPVENLPDGRHQLTAVAVDAAGNRTDGKPVTLTVDTVAPDRPTLTSPQPDETVKTPRPRLAGRAEPGATVTVTTRTGTRLGATPTDGGGSLTLCSGTAAADGTWACIPVRDLAPGDQTLRATATDRAGNGTPGEAVAIHVALATQPPSPSPSPSPSPAPSPSPSASAGATASPSTSPVPGPSESPSPAVPSGSAGAGTAPATGASGSPAPGSGSPVPSPAPSGGTAGPSSSPATGGSPSASPGTAPSGAPDLVIPLPPGLFPIVVPPAFPDTGTLPGGLPSTGPGGLPSPGTGTGSPAAGAGPTPSGEPSTGTGPAPGSPTGAGSPTGGESPSTGGGAGSPTGAPSPGSGAVSGSPAAGAVPSPDGPPASGAGGTGPSTGGATASPTGGPPPGTGPAHGSPSVPGSAVASGGTNMPQSGSPAAGTAAAPGGAPPSAPAVATGSGSTASGGPSASASGSPSGSPSASGGPSGRTPSAGHSTGIALPPDAVAEDAADGDPRTLAAPPASADAEEQDTAAAAAHRSAVVGWRGVACGVLLVLAAVGLLTRRVLGRGTGSRRR